MIYLDAAFMDNGFIFVLDIGEWILCVKFMQL